MNINETLKERGETYGKFSDYANTSAQIKEVMDYKNNPNLNAVHQEALSMIVSKISRILNGDPNHADNWHDIAGYATLVEKEINEPF